MLMIGMPKQLGYRLSSKKLNKRQFKKGCGYKEISVTKKPIMPTTKNPVMRVTETMTYRDKTLMVNGSSGVTERPLFGAKTFKRRSGK